MTMPSEKTLNVSDRSEELIPVDVGGKKGKIILKQVLKTNEKTQAVVRSLPVDAQNRLLRKVLDAASQRDLLLVTNGYEITRGIPAFTQDEIRNTIQIVLENIVILMIKKPRRSPRERARHLIQSGAIAKRAEALLSNSNTRDKRSLHPMTLELGDEGDAPNNAAIPTEEKPQINFAESLPPDNKFFESVEVNPNFRGQTTTGLSVAEEPVIKNQDPSIDPSPEPSPGEMVEIRIATRDNFWGKKIFVDASSQEAKRFRIASFLLECIQRRLPAPLKRLLFSTQTRLYLESIPESQEDVAQAADRDCEKVRDLYEEDPIDLADEAIIDEILESIRQK